MTLSRSARAWSAFAFAAFLLTHTVLIGVYLVSAHAAGWAHFRVGNKFTVGADPTIVSGYIGWPLVALHVCGASVQLWRLSKQVWTGRRQDVGW